MLIEDVPQVATIYMASFGGAFLTRLGSEFLESMFKAFVKGSPRECSIVCIDAQKHVVGFVCGSKDRAAYIRSFVLRHWMEALPAIAGAVSRDRGTALALWLRIWQNRQAILGSWLAPPDGKGSLPAASLMTVAVAPNYRDKGMGTALVGAFMDEMARRGVTALRLAVSEDNLKARRLYERLGWEVSAAAGGRARSRYYLRTL
jgi:ribosomal protein S18 acetylase RimI-like enzyme